MLDHPTPTRRRTAFVDHLVLTSVEAARVRDALDHEPDELAQSIASRCRAIAGEPDQAATPDVLGALAAHERAVAAAAAGTARDARGYRQPAVTMPGYHAGRTPKNKGRKYPPTPPTVEEVVAMLETCQMDRVAGRRLCALIVVLWRAGLRISEALDLTEQDLDPREHSIVVRCGKGGKRRIVGMDEWGWENLQPWLDERATYPVGELFCVVSGNTAGRAISGSSARGEIKALAARAGVRHRVAPHQFRHAHAVDSVREEINIVHLSRQLGHTNLAVTTTYVQGISPAEVVNTYGGREAPKVKALGRRRIA